MVSDSVIFMALFGLCAGFTVGTIAMMIIRELFG